MPVKHLILDAGPHHRRNTFVCLDVGGPDICGVLSRADSGKHLSGQVIDGTLYFVLDELAAGEQCKLVFEPGQESDISGVKFDHNVAKGYVAMQVAGEPLTTYHYDQVPFRPYLHPLVGPHGVHMTRAYPMVENIEGETDDHLHHRSVWVAFGDVNGVDHWGETEDCGVQVHRKINKICDGPVLGIFEHELQWQGQDHKPSLSETRRVSVCNTPQDARQLDLQVILLAGDKPVVFGDTKEGGICSVRVATTMDGKTGGKIENSVGGVGEDETWGKPAHWCDYSGVCQGKDVGIAIFDHPLNLRHPTPWHVRNYGLMAANPFGHSHYQSSLLKDGSYTIEAGQTLAFNYRLLLHEGDVAQGNVANRFHDYVHPPNIQLSG